jgi:hypothetical protein
MAIFARLVATLAGAYIGALIGNGRGQEVFVIMCIGGAAVGLAFGWMIATENW